MNYYRGERKDDYREEETFRYSRGDYQYESTVRRPREYEEEYRGQGNRQTGRRKAQKKEYSVGNLIATVVMIGAFALCAWSTLRYVQLRSDFTSTVKTLASSRVELSNLRSQNDASLARIETSVDLEQIESVARGELGMKYASEGQVYFYSSAENDYMRRVGE